MTFAYVSGSPALDLAGTVESRREEPVDLLATPADLERWVAECDGLPDRVTADLEGFEASLALREAIYRLALDRVLGRPFDPDSLRSVNHTATGPLPTLRLDDAGVVILGDLPAVRTMLARNAITVLGDPHIHPKECGRAGCTRIYLDRSRGGRRAWCGMESCGNRVKAAAYRARRRASGTPGGRGAEDA